MKSIVYIFVKDEFAGDGVDLYDDVIATPTGGNGGVTGNNTGGNDSDSQNATNEETNGNAPYHQLGNNIQPNQIGRRHQLYIGNLTWWTSDQDITDAVQSIGVSDFVEVKFFENRANGQSKGFCVVSLGSEQSMRNCMERLPKKELHGQNPVVTFPTKQALNQFESQCKTRPVPAPQQNSNQRPHNPHQHPAPMAQHQGHPPHTQHPQHPQQNHGGPRMMMGPPQGGPRPQRMPPPGMGGPQGPGGPGQQGHAPRMHGPPMGPGGPPHHMSGHPNQGPPPPGYQQGHWNGPRPNGPPGPPRGPPGGPQQQGPGPGPGQHRPPGMVFILSFFTHDFLLLVFMFYSFILFYFFSNFMEALVYLVKDHHVVHLDILVVPKVIHEVLHHVLNGIDNLVYI